MLSQLQYTAAAKTSTLDSTAQALARLHEVFKRDRKLPAILAAPTLTPSDKSQIVNELIKHTGLGGADKNNETIKNFLKTLAENNRLGILQGVCEKFGSLISVHRGEVELVVTSAAVSILFLFSLPIIRSFIHAMFGMFLSNTVCLMDCFMWSIRPSSSICCTKYRLRALH